MEKIRAMWFLFLSSNIFKEPFFILKLHPSYFLGLPVCFYETMENKTMLVVLFGFAVSWPIYYIYIYIYTNSVSFSKVLELLINLGNPK